jgi:hypothetical protein
VGKLLSSNIRLKRLASSQQAHLCPLPVADSTSFAPSAFILEHTPDVLIIAESRAQFTAKQAGKHTMM